jgi:hypothetical protein
VLDEDAGDLAAGSVIDFMPLTEALAQTAFAALSLSRSRARLL